MLSTKRLAHIFQCNGFALTKIFAVSFKNSKTLGNSLIGRVNLSLIMSMSLSPIKADINES